MNNTVAIYLAIFLAALVLFDFRVNDGEYLIFWAKYFLRAIEWIAFWR